MYISLSYHLSRYYSDRPWDGIGMRLRPPRKTCRRGKKTSSKNVESCTIWMERSRRESPSKLDYVDKRQDGVYKRPGDPTRPEPKASHLSSQSGSNSDNNPQVSNYILPVAPAHPSPPSTIILQSRPQAGKAAFTMIPGFAVNNFVGHCAHEVKQRQYHTQQQQQQQYQTHLSTNLAPMGPRRLVSKDARHLSRLWRIVQAVYSQGGRRTEGQIAWWGNQYFCNEGTEGRLHDLDEWDARPLALL
ncbi:hypothetical protein BKA70DRAFT_1237720 [Coprinopsis sp. MPI-PUGE-AT-0042]|nr:hypothetical protein BKA70DRAFT_1237720 [Coprinopsis sp. MPI-PUGE-AT-0042]